MRDIYAYPRKNIGSLTLGNEETIKIQEVWPYLPVAAKATNSSVSLKTNKYCSVIFVVHRRDMKHYSQGAGMGI